MALPPASDKRRRFEFGQHLLNGLTVGLGVGAVTILFSQLFGFRDGMAAGIGAICISLGDTPNPLANKLKILPFSFLLALVSSFLIAVTFGHPALQGVIVILVSAVAGLLVGYGRWALPVSVLTMLAVVFTLGAPLDRLDQALNHEALFAAGGFCYLLVALAATRVTEESSRRIAVAECLREFSLYLRTIGDFYEPAVPLAEVYRRVVEQQASLADHLQAARQQVFLGSRSESAKRLAAAIIVQLDVLDAAVSAHADYAPLRRGECGETLPRLVAALARELSDDLKMLAYDLLRYRSVLSLPDRRPSLDRIGGEIRVLVEEGRGDARSQRAARATRAKFAWVTEHLDRLPKVLQNEEAAAALLKGVDLSAFLQPLTLSPLQLRRHLQLSSPVLRHAIRLSLAMATGYALISLVPGLSHSNWILLTIAVILRAQYAVTRQRRNDRLIGNLIGCLIAASLLKLAPKGLQLGLIPVAIGIGHAYARVNYLVTSVAACVMAILSLHFLDPVAAPPIMARLLDTVIGAAICLLFARLLPRWEYHEAPRLVATLMKAFTAYVDGALRVVISEQAYRLARKTMLDSFAAVTESVARAAAEPAHAQAKLPEPATLLSAAYGLAAQIVGIRMLLRHRRQDIDAHFAENLLERTRAVVLGQLDLSHEEEHPSLAIDGEEAQLDAEKALRLRCSELCLDAVRLHRVAAQYQSLGE